MNIVVLEHDDAEKFLSKEEFMKLFPLRFERYKNYKFANDRQRCLGVGVLLYEVLGLCEKDLYYNRLGKPLSKKGEMFSVSHSGDFVVLASEKGLVGVDLERMEKGYLDIMPQVFTAEETAFVNDDLKSFYQIWTLKESLLKAVEEDGDMPFNQISVLELIKGESIIYKGKTLYGGTRCFEQEEYVLSWVSDKKTNPRIIKLKNKNREVV
ncbi:MAG: 4'-phosphopantetheinyl transferase superfamily protein [Eubacteriales bacterium]|nr:4'-phosphopantetheinyl transferase superfamily protein [Eubacteriales bacterium]